MRNVLFRLVWAYVVVGGCESGMFSSALKPINMASERFKYGVPESRLWLLWASLAVLQGVLSKALITVGVVLKFHPESGALIAYAN